jgi:hypothetical protein
MEGSFMRKALALAVVALAFVLAGCATTENYERILQSWVGRTELDLVRAWGAPQRTYETGGSKFLVYSSGRNVYIAGTPPAYTTTIVGGTAYTSRIGGTPGQVIGMRCQTTFELKEDKVIAWQWHGNDCAARE